LVISHTGDEASQSLVLTLSQSSPTPVTKPLSPQSSLSHTQSADLTLSPQSSQAAASVLVDLILSPHSQAFSPRKPNNYHSFSPSVLQSSFRAVK
ncbi:hypothetical protein Ancab_028841, partial [Ancistrocladus abbreviatus]